MKQEKSQLKIGSILSYGQMLMSVIIGLAYTPIMIQLLGKSEYGLYNTVSSTISMLSILNLGFNSSYIRYFARYKRNNDIDSINKLNGLFLIIFVIIGAVAFACGMFLTFHLDMVFDTGLTASEYEKAKILMTLLTINLSISFPMSVFSNIISANERFIFLKILSMAKTIASPLISLPLLLMGYRSVAIVAVTVGISLITDVFYLYYVLKKLKNKFVFHGFEKGIFVSLFSYTIFIAINIIVDQVNWNIDKLLLGRFRGTESVAVYSVGSSLYSYYMLFSTSISGVFVPRIHRIYNETKEKFLEQRKQLTDLFVKVGRIQFIVLALLATGIIFFGKEFIGFWAGKGYEDSYFVALLLIIPATIALTQNVGIEIQRAENKHWFRSVAYAIMALINLGLSIYLCQKYGAIGSAIGTAISLVLANGIVMNIYYQKACNISVFVFWKNILRVSLGLIIPIGFGILAKYFISFDTLLELVAGIAVYTIIYAVSMWLFGMNKYEKALIKEPVKKLTKRVIRK